MCGRSSTVRKRGFGPRRELWGRPGGSGSFFGLDTRSMNPKAQVAAALAELAPVTVSGFVLIAFAPSLWWVFTTYFWVAFPALGLLARGIAGLSEVKPEPPSANSKERELLEALRREEELTPVLAAVGTSLTVAEAERMLKELAEGGHLEVRARGGGLFYSLWGTFPGAQHSGREAKTREITEGKKGAT